MYNLELSDLTPGRKYRVSVSATRDGYRESELSPVFEFTTSQDTVPPAEVKNLTIVSEGDSFVANWEKPTSNADGTNCHDFSHYIVSIADMTSPTGKSREFILAQNTYTLTFDMNAEMFGKPKGQVGIRVRAVDQVGNIGNFVDAVAQNPVPEKVKNVSAKAAVESIELSWSLNDESDISGYEIYMSNNPQFTSANGVKVGEVANGTNKFIFTSFSFEDVYMVVLAKDKFSQKSADSDIVSAKPKLSTDYDKTPPLAVQNFAVQQVLSEDQNYSVAKITYTANSEADLDKYDVQFRKTGATSDPWSFRNVPSDENQASVYPLLLDTSYDFKIRAIDFNANKGPWSNVITASGVQKTTNPDVPTELTAMGGNTNVMLTWEGSADSSMSNGKGTYEISYDLSEDFNDEKTLKTGSTIATVANLLANTVYYFRVRAIDPFGNKSNWTDSVETNTGIIPGSAWVDPRDFTKIDGGKIYTGTIDAGSIKSHSIDATQIVVGGLDAATVIKDGTIVTEKLGAQAITAEKIKSGTITGDLISANTSLINDLFVNNTMTIRDTGNIRSENYSEENNTGFYLDKQQLIINQGRISAAAIELQSSQNIMPPQYASFNYSQKYYTNTAMLANSVSLARAETGGLNGPCLAATASASPSAFRFSRSASEYNINFDTTSDYIVSFYAKAAASVTARIALYFSGGNKFAPDITIAASGSTWKRYSAVIPASDITSSAGALGVYIINSIGILVAFDRFQIESKTSVSEKPSVWSPPGITSIDGGSITTGSISSSVTVPTSNGTKAAWSIDTGGNATFADASVNGKMIVASGAVGEEDISIVSSNYVKNQSGWKIAGNGDVEFESGKFRGTVDLSKNSSGGSVPIKMTMSVSPTKVYTDGTNSSTIDTPNINGTTYSYNRVTVDDTSGIYVPTTADTNKEGVFFIGPTTERSVNIQVHDSGEKDSVYLEQAPNNVIISSLTVGEQVNSSAAPTIRENQGVEYRTERSESKNYVFGGISAREDTNAASNIGASGVRLRSPLYPESSLNGEQSPASTHEFTSKIHVQTPRGKNMLNSTSAIFGRQASSAYRRNQLKSATNYNLGATGYGITYYQHNRAGTARYYYSEVDKGVTLASNTEYIFSINVDTTLMQNDLFMSAFLGGTQMTPLEPADPTELPSATDLRSTATLWMEFQNGYKNSGSAGDMNGGGNTVGNGYMSSPSGQKFSIYGQQSSPYDPNQLPGMDMGNGGTVAFWLRVRGGSTGDVIFHRASETGSPPDKEFWITRASGNTFQGGLKFSNTVVKNWTATESNLFSTTGTESSWVHVTASMSTSSANRNLKIYVNGSQIAVSTTGTTGSGAFGSRDFLYFGGNQQDDNKGFVGDFDDILVFNRELSVDEVESLASLPRSGDVDSLGTQSKYTKVNQGTAKKRVAFYAQGFNPRTADLGIVFGTNSPSGPVLAEAQLEPALYKNDTDLPEDVRESHLPTLWSAGRVDAVSEATLRLEASPLLNENDYKYASGVSSVLSTRQVRDGEGRSPASLVLDLATSYSGGDTQASASARYRFSPTGIVYPGTGVPFLPTAATVDYDYSSKSNSSKAIGGGYSDRIVNMGPVSLSEPVVHYEYFSASKDVKGVPPRWVISGPEQAGGFWLNSSYGGGVQTLKNINHDLEVEFGAYYAYSARPLDSYEQDLTINVGKRNAYFTDYYPISGIVMSLDPQTGDRIVFRIHQNSGAWNIYKFTNNVRSTIASGTTTTGNRNYSVINAVRTGNTIKLYNNGSSIYSGTHSGLPSGSYYGLVVHNGYVDNYRATTSGTVTNPVGVVAMNSVNLNNNRGLSVDKNNGMISTMAAGYYMVTVRLTSTGTGFGNHFADQFWISVDSQVISSRISRYDGAGTKTIVASGVVYLAGAFYFRIHTTDGDENYLESGQITIVRMA